MNKYDNELTMCMKYDTYSSYATHGGFKFKKIQKLNKQQYFTDNHNH